MRNGKNGTSKVRKGRDQVVASSGNVFQDIGVSHPEEALYKADLAAKIAEIIDDRGLTQQKAAAVLGIDQPGVSKLLRGQLRGYSCERLLGFLVTLNRSVEIRVNSGRSRKPQIQAVLV